METSNGLPKFAVLQLSGCSGCEVSLLNSEEWISNFQLVYMPLVVTANKIPDDVEVLLVAGACARMRTSIICAKGGHAPGN